MNNLNTLENEANQLLSQVDPSLSDLRRVSIEIDDFINSPAYQALELDRREQVQNLYRDLMSRIRNHGEGPGFPLRSSEPPMPAASDDSWRDTGRSAGDFNRPPAKDHNPELVQLMDEAEKLFYGGRYSEAVKLYDQVLSAEPGWERAKQHRAEAENYLRTGYIPAVALPSEAATAFGKAQSAARVGRYTDAQSLLDKAKSVLRESGIKPWQEVKEFEAKLQQMIDAENAYE